MNTEQVCLLLICGVLLLLLDCDKLSAECVLVVFESSAVFGNMSAKHKTECLDYFVDVHVASWT